MFTPTHWKNRNFTSILLWPLGCLYGLATALRIALTRPQKINAKVICVGNLTAGGTGKTPVSIALAKLLAEQKRNPFFVTRGYGGKLQDVLVDSTRHSAGDVGDEPLLLAKQASVIVNHNRFAGAQKAVSLGADTIIMDDGFQNPGLHKDLSFLVIDGEFGFGNGFCIPAGPLREFVYRGLQRAQAAIIVGADKNNLAQTLNIPTFHARITPIISPINNPKIVAFAGIGRPQKFYKSLQDCGFQIVKTVDFPDHHFYQEEELQELISLAQNNNAEIYTTSKDYVKIPAHLRSNFKVLEIEITWDAPEQLASFMANNL